MDPRMMVPPGAPLPDKIEIPRPKIAREEQQEQFLRDMEIDPHLYYPDDADRDNPDLTMLKLRQIGFADLVILNKADLIGPDNVRVIEEWIGSLLPRVRVVEANYCDVPLEILLSVGRFDPAALPDDPDGHVHEHDVGFETWHYQTDEPLSESALAETIRKLPGSVYRCKGIVRSADRPSDRVVVQAVGRRSSMTTSGAWGNRAPATNIVAIGAKGSLDHMALRNAFDACRIGPSSKR